LRHAFPEPTSLSPSSILQPPYKVPQRFITDPAAQWFLGCGSVIGSVMSCMNDNGAKPSFTLMVDMSLPIDMFIGHLD
jgi:hypothetical protein